MESDTPQKQGGNREIGPGKPPAEYQFKPGQSGNPGGRPKGRSIAAILRELLDQTELGGQAIPNGKRAIDMLGEAMLKHALKGDIRHIQEVLNRTEGKVPDRVATADEGDVRTILVERARETVRQRQQLPGPEAETDDA